MRTQLLLPCSFLASFALAACDPEIPLAIPEDGGLHGDGTSSGDAGDWLQLGPSEVMRDQVDILFVIDDSGSMAPKQQALRTRFPDLLKVLDNVALDTPDHQGIPISYHIGVITSDMGAPAISCGKNRGGKLQQIGAAATGCEGPTSGNFLIYDQKNPTNNNNPATQDLPTTFSCMAQVGDKGCGFEMPLEAAYRALHDPIPENQGFLRAGAILAVIFLTDEDDCSADPTSDVFTGNPNYGPLNSFRCTRYGVICDGQPLPTAPQASFGSCVPATPAQGGKLSILDKYISFFTKPATQGGIKNDPRDVVLAAISAKETPFGTSTHSDQSVCGQGVASCTLLSPSCVASSDSTFFGDPAVRLNAVINSATNHQLASICDTDYKIAVEAIANRIVGALEPACVSLPLSDAAHPNCVVEDVSFLDPSSRTPIPACTENGGATPCWIAKQSTGCPRVCNPMSGQFQTIGIEITRGGVPAPSDTVAEISCQIIHPAGDNPNAACGL